MMQLNRVYGLCDPYADLPVQDFRSRFLLQNWPELLGVSPRYLLQIGARTAGDAGFVSVSFGAAGGYRLSRLPGEISLLDVITAMEGRTDLSECRSCIKEKQEFRLLRHVYEELEIGIARQLQAVTICELLPEE